MKTENKKEGKEIKIAGPQIREEALAEPSDPLEALLEAKEEEEELTGLLLRGIQAAGCDFSGIRLKGVVLENCRFSSCRFSAGSLTDLRVRACDFSYCDFTAAYFSRCRLESVKGVGIRAAESRMADQRWTDCNFRYGNFHGSKIRYLAVRDCDLSESFFTACQWKEMEIRNTSLRGASLTNTPLKGLDLSDCAIEGIIVSDPPWELRGLTVDLYQAAALAALLGLRMKE